MQSLVFLAWFFSKVIEENPLVKEGLNINLNIYIKYRWF